MLTLPESFGCVEEGVYRCVSVDPINVQFLTTLGLKMIISINPDKPPKVVRNFVQDHSIELVHLGLRPWRNSSNNWMLLSKELIQDCMKYVLDKQNHPVLILDSTNAFVSVLRRLQHWNYSAVVAEYRQFNGGKSHYMTEIFIELVDLKCIDHEEAMQRRKSTDRIHHMPQPLFENDNEEERPIEKKKSTQISITLPPEDVMADWFLRQHNLWKQDRQRRKQPTS